MKAIYKDNADTIVGNMDSQIFLGWIFEASAAQKFPISSRQQSYMIHRFFGRV